MGFLYSAGNKRTESTVSPMQAQPMLPAFDSQFSSENDQHSNGEVEPGPPHEALFFVLAYFNVMELLAMSEVCKLLRDAVDKDVLPWQDIIIDRPLSSRLCDEILVQISSRANGKLRTLALINCFKITDDGLQNVVEKNSFINKLHIPGCTGLTTEGIMRTIKTLSQRQNSLKSLQMCNIYIKREHLQTIFSHLQIDPAQKKPQPLLYHHHTSSPTSTKEQSSCMIDVDICRKCNEVRVVYDCPRESGERGSTHCRGCWFCIPRCEECGRCADGEEVEEALCFGILCTDCWLHLPKCCFCNKARCKLHGNQQSSSPDSATFFCDVCKDRIACLGQWYLEKNTEQ